MIFKVKKINNKPSKTQSKASSPSPKTKRIIKIKIPIIISVVIVILLLVGIVKAVGNINFNVFLKIAGDELITDKYGHTNFLILGTGDKNHEGADLTDTIILASLDDENKLISMLSIPRDLYIKDKEVGNSKINEALHYGKIYYESEIKGIEYLKGKVERLTGTEIHYWARINFQGFKDLVDALGGIDIFVEEDIYDPYYPKDGTYLYETFSISAGQHHLDGETALKYARSRKTTSDFDRAQRQQQIIYAIKEKALQTETILNQEKVKKLLNALKSNIDTNIKVGEILTLGAIASEYGQDSITQRLIHDDPIKCGGFVYPPNPEYYNDQFVLIPAGGYEKILIYADLIFNYPLIAQENIKLYVLNATAEYGIAGETKQVLQRYCFDIVGFGNAASTNLDKTTYYYQQLYDGNGEPVESVPEAISFLQKYIPGELSTQIPEEYKNYLVEADLIIELGSDYVNSDNYMLDDFYYLPSPTHSTNPFINLNGTSEDPDLQTNENETE